MVLAAGIILINSYILNMETVLSEQSLEKNN